MDKYRFHSLNKKPRKYHGKLCVVKDARETVVDRARIFTVEFSDGKQMDVFESELAHAPQTTTRR